ncbi:putative reverse transcriptase domain, Ribonuclease H-like domain protein [Senna tora]|uniref:Putative reverse transcriptase domain, Ribonuclease H-like domain protein n=1 Tax=Senna tora TaxID=362788 RepID=A0A835CK16_9FABA|nr:putative reverse transcriptase domain, Ribonuclease H-like domain protein [Senna tora]
MSKLESQGKLPSQTEVNPRQNVSAITLRIGKELEELPKIVSRGHGSSAEAEPEAEVVVQKPPKRVREFEKTILHNGDPELKLKQLPKHLKHAFLEAQVEEERLITTLREYKDGIGRVIMDVKGFNTSTFMQIIVLEENYKPIQEAEFHLNHPVMEVFKKEFHMLITNMNYLILDSKLGSEVQLMPKNIGVTVMGHSELGHNVVPKPRD